MLPDISEFSYGFALTNELINYYSFLLAGAPRFPTQNEEGKKGGHDVELPIHGTPLFLQFKRCECLVSKAAKQSANLGNPHYRFYLRPRRHSAQHALLMQSEGAGNEVYYVAPLFHTSEELNDAYLTNMVAMRSAFVPPSFIGALTDDDDHYLALSADNKDWLFCTSEPRRIDSVSASTVVNQRVPAASARRRLRIDDEFFLSVGDEIVENYERFAVHGRSRERTRADQLRARLRPADYARELAQILYGCELLIVPSQEH
jgi:hypothetical protein